MVHAENTCTLGTNDSATFAQNDAPSMYLEGQDFWLKLDSSTKWMPGKVIQILLFMSYMVKLIPDGHIFQRNEHHLTRRLSCIKHRATSGASENSHSYNLRPRTAVKHLQWPDLPAEAKQGTVNFELLEEL